MRGLGWQTNEPGVSPYKPALKSTQPVLFTAHTPDRWENASQGNMARNQSRCGSVLSPESRAGKRKSQGLVQCDQLQVGSCARLAN